MSGRTLHHKICHLEERRPTVVKGRRATPAMWLVAIPGNPNLGEFPTHAEAIAYADRMARRG